MRRYLDEVQYREQYFGALYLTVGERPDAHGVNC
jgi:hypothetical protein